MCIPGENMQGGSVSGVELPELRGQHTEHLFELGGELALALVPHCPGHLGQAVAGLQQQGRRLFHPVLPDVGGDIEAGLAIAEMVAGMTKPTVTLVLGGGHSIGIPLAVSGQQTFIVPSASMTVHPVRMSGLMIAAPQSYRYFERVQESIVSFVARHSRITQDDFRQLMLADGDMSNDVGTILYGSQAVQLGLIDRLGTLSDALEALYGMIGKNG